ncbi:hypothetical protein FPANT_5215 [Fusarium pseudoanthophilum]|uniref:Uncharacterized protein n=1 Tax=Fusarium pseudoanthophilum TaxID=48495 RepID=A0A8H5PAT4_9HYPO|nr:hypothetical protein FPANT_5215 [Fusarium pseudoanthophilum]
MSKTLYLFRRDDNFSEDVTNRGSAANTATSWAIHDRVPIDVKEAATDRNGPKIFEIFCEKSTATGSVIELLASRPPAHPREAADQVHQHQPTAWVPEAKPQEPLGSCLYTIETSVGSMHNESYERPHPRIPGYAAMKRAGEQSSPEARSASNPSTIAVNDHNGELIESNGHLAIENEELKKKLALTEERQQKYFEFRMLTSKYEVSIFLIYYNSPGGTQSPADGSLASVYPFHIEHRVYCRTCLNAPTRQDKCQVSMTTAEIPWSVLRAPEEESVAPETKANGLEALDDEETVVGDVESFVGDYDDLLLFSAFQRPRTLSTLETMPPEEDLYAVPSSEPDMEQNASEPLNEGVFIALATDDGAEDNKPVEIIEPILDPDHHLVDFQNLSNKWQINSFQMFGPDVIGPRFHGNDWGMRRAGDLSFEAQRPEESTLLSIDTEDIKKKLALAEERAQRYFDFWRCAEDELTRQLELNDELKKQLEAAKTEEPEA